MISVISKPITKITGDTSNTSKWVGIHQPVEFEVKRKDYDILSKGGIYNQPQNDGTALALTWFRITDIGEIKVGDIVNFLCGPEEKKRSFTLTVAKINLVSTGNYSFIFFDLNDVIDADKITAYKAYVNVQRKGYYIETFVYQSIKNDNLDLAGVVRSKVDVWGNAKINIQKILSSNVTNENKSSYTKINEPVYNQGGIYNIKIREVYDGYVGAFTTLLNTDNLYFVNGSKQLQDPNNFNFGEFVPTLNDSRVSKAKFLSVFDKPTYFNNYPFDVSFIYSDNLLNKQVARVETINGNPSNTNLLTNGRGFVNRLKLAGGYASSVKTIDIYLDASTSATTQNPSTGTGTLAGVGTIFNPFSPTIRHKLSDLNAWIGAYNDTLRPVTYERY